jgi:hypothetical protein
MEIVEFQILLNFHLDFLSHDGLFGRIHAFKVVIDVATDAVM